MERQKDRVIKVLGIIVFAGLMLVTSWFLFYNTYNTNENAGMEPVKEVEIILPPPQKTSETSIEEALLKRRSVRDYKDEPLSLREISQVLWAAQGVTSPEFGGRTAPSAGALYPLEVYLAVRAAEEIKPGVYKYLSDNHKLIKILDGDISDQLAGAALGQISISNAPVNLVFSAVFERTTEKYGQRGTQYAYMEAGHAAQNVYLQVQSLGLATVAVGAFSDDEVKEILNLPKEEIPLYLMPVGKPH